MLCPVRVMFNSERSFAVRMSECKVSLTIKLALMINKPRYFMGHKPLIDKFYANNNPLIPCSEQTSSDLIKYFK